MRKGFKRCLVMFMCITMLLESQGLTVYAAEDLESSEEIALETAESDEVADELGEETEEEPLLMAGKEENSDFEIKDGVLVKYKGNDEEVTIPDSVTGIGDCAFYECRSLTEVTIPNSVKTIGKWAFEYCYSLTKVTIPDSVEEIGFAAFYGCCSLTKVTIPDSVEEIGPSVFCHCRSLKEVTISDSVTWISVYAFWNCSSLEEVTIPDSVTEIGYDAFGGCSSLKEVTIPDSVKKIGYDAFVHCSSLKEVTIPDSVKEIGQRAFNKVEVIHGVPGSEAEKYAKANKIKFVAIENTTEPVPQPIYGPTNEEIQQIVEKNMWTKDPSEYTHEEVVHSLECLAALQKEQLQDQSTKDYFLETYRNNREAVKAQVADTLAAFNISFEEVEAIFKRVIFE